MTIQISNPPSQPQPRVGKFEGNQSNLDAKIVCLRERQYGLWLWAHMRERERICVVVKVDLYIFFY